MERHNKSLTVTKTFIGPIALIDVFRWLARGMTNAKIGAILGLSRNTVRTHLERIYQKLGVQTRTAAAALAYRENLKPGIGELGSNSSSLPLIQPPA